MILKNKTLNKILLSMIFITTTISLPGFSEEKKEHKKEEIDILKPGTMLNKTYKIEDDDNYFNIAKKYNLNYKKLMEINNAETPYVTTGHTIILTKETEPSNKYNGIIINIPEQKLYFFYKGSLSHIYKVSTGSPEDRWQTPIGNFKILFKDKEPTWYVPISIQNDMKKRGRTVIKEIKPGIKNPLGKWFLGINNSGLGIHSTNAPSSIGYSVTHSCIRMNPNSASELFHLVNVGMPVKIIYQTIKIDINNKKEVYLEVYKNIYQNKLNSVSNVKKLIEKYNIKEKDIDWKIVQKTINEKNGFPTLISKKS